MPLQLPALAVRRPFINSFTDRTGLTPAAFAALGDASEFTLQLPRDYRTQEILAFFSRDKEGVSERVGATGFAKCFESEGHAIHVEVSFAKHSATCRTDRGHAWPAHHAVLRMLGFESDAAAFERQVASVSKDEFNGLFQRQRGLRIPCTPEPWEALGWAIMGQQISLQAAVSLRRGLIGALGQQHASGLKAFPSANVVANVDIEFLRGLGFSASKAEYLLAAARAVANGEVPVEKLRQLSIHHAARVLAPFAESAPGPSNMYSCVAQDLLTAYPPGMPVLHADSAS